jgi:hypothetical protein
VAVRFGIHALGVEAEVFGQAVEKGAVRGGHGFESQSPLRRIGGEDAKVLFLDSGPLHVVLVELEGLVGVRDVVVDVGSLVDVEGEGEFAVPLKAGALIVAF